MKPLLALFLVILPACTQKPPQPAVVNGQPRDHAKPWAWGLDQEGKVWLGYYGKDLGFYLKQQGAPERRVNPPGEAAPSGLAFEVAEPDVYALWRDKQVGKNLMLARSGDGGKTFSPPVLLDKDSDPLTRLKLKAASQGLYVLWLGEKNKSYDLYFTHSEDRGQTFADTLKVLPGIYPAWVVDEKGVFVFSWGNLEGKDYFAVRRFDPATKDFGETVKIKESPKSILPLFDAFRSGQRLFLAWVGQYGQMMNEMRLEGGYSDDDGKTWQDFAIKAPEGIDFSEIQFCQDGTGHVYAAYSGAQRFTLPDSREKVYLVRSEDNGATWGEPQELRHEAFPNTQARYPSIACDDQGRVLVAFEDWRSLRPGVFLNYSSDYGATWKAGDYPLARPKDNLGLDPLVPALEEHLLSKAEGGGAEYYLMALKYKNDGLSDNDLALYTITPEFFQGEPPKIQAPSAGSLKKRVDAYWRAFEKADYKKAYPLNDPFFRARKLLEEYLVKRGPIKYHSHEIKDIRVEGNIAKVDMAIEYSVPKIKLGLKEFSRGLTKAAFTETWIYIDGKWFREFKDEESGHTYTRY